VLAFVRLIGSLALIQTVLGIEPAMSVTLSERVRVTRVVALWVRVGSAVEVIFHGVIQRSLEGITGFWPAIVAGGMLCAMFHVDHAALALSDPLLYIHQGGFGIIAGWVYTRTEDLEVPITPVGWPQLKQSAPFDTVDWTREQRDRQRRHSANSDDATIPIGNSHP